MRRLVRTPGWYGDCTLEGDDVYLVRDSHLVVNGNSLSLPPRQSNLLQLVTIRYNGQIIIAGQGQSYSNWLWKDNKWTDLGPSFATFSCAFGADNLYFVCGPNQYRVLSLVDNSISPIIGRAIGSNGIRYIDFEQSPDGIITGDATYGPQPFNMAQWSRYQDSILGQSYIDGALVQYGSTRYMIEPGDTQFLRLHRSGNSLAIAIVKMPESSTVFYWMTLDELKEFPIQFTADQKVPGPVVNSSTTVKNKMTSPAEYIKQYNLPTLDKWLNQEYPQLRNAYINAQGGNIPGDDWASFQTYRRFMEPNVWTFEKMLAWEQNGGQPPVNPQ